MESNHFMLDCMSTCPQQKLESQRVYLSHKTKDLYLKIEVGMASTNPQFLRAPFC